MKTPLLYKILFKKDSRNRSKSELLRFWFKHYIAWRFWNIFRKIHRKTKLFIDQTFKEHIYITCWSRDCDMFESTTASVCYGRKAFEKIKEEAYEWAEGPVSWEEISKEEYEDFQPYHRDRIMEAYENGNGTSIYV